MAAGASDHPQVGTARFGRFEAPRLKRRMACPFRTSTQWEAGGCGHTNPQTTAWQSAERRKSRPTDSFLAVCENIGKVNEYVTYRQCDMRRRCRLQDPHDLLGLSVLRVADAAWWQEVAGGSNVEKGMVGGCASKQKSRWRRQPRNEIELESNRQKVTENVGRERELKRREPCYS